MIDIIEELEMVNALTDGFPFICPVCGEEHRDWDYLRIFLKGSPNPHCIHLKCLLSQMNFRSEGIMRATETEYIALNCEACGKPVVKMHKLLLGKIREALCYVGAHNPHFYHIDCPGGLESTQEDVIATEDIREG